MSGLTSWRRPLLRLLMPVCLLGLLSGCTLSGLSFRQDLRVAITEPHQRVTLRLPVTVSWTVHDFQLVGPGQGPAQGDRAGYFAVFVDQAPQPPGDTLRWLARNDHTCRASEGCPNASYFADRGVYTTTQTAITLEQLQRPAVEHGAEPHFVTIILLDPTGHRIGESAFRVDFKIKRKALV